MLILRCSWVLCPILPCTRGLDKLERVQWRSTKIMKWFENFSCVERLRKLELFSLEERRLRDLISVHKNLKWGGNEGGTTLPSQLSSARSKGNDHKHEHKFPLNIKKHIFSTRVTEHWHRLPGEVVESLLGDTQKPLGYGPGQPAPGGFAWAVGLGKITSESPFHRIHSVILWPLTLRPVCSHKTC